MTFNSLNPQVKDAMKRITPNKQPAIFYVPHPDDEAISMAGAICEHKETGGPVYLVLLTDGYNEKVLKILNGQTFCTLHNTYHRFSLTMEQLMWARKFEFIASARELGADKVFIVNDGRGFSDLRAYDDTSFEQLESHIQDTIIRFETLFPGASHRLPSGPLDTFGSTDTASQGKTQPTHMVCWQAAVSLHPKITDIKFYRVYIYLKPKYNRNFQGNLQLKPSWQVTKQNALNQYKLFLPEANRFAIGYHSVRSLIDAAFEDDTEYIDFLP